VSDPGGDAAGPHLHLHRPPSPPFMGATHSLTRSLVSRAPFMPHGLSPVAGGEGGGGGVGKRRKLLSQVVRAWVVVVRCCGGGGGGCCCIMQASDRARVLRAGRRDAGRAPPSGEVNAAAGALRLQHLAS
jgi:hypothetical protein